MGTVGDVRVDTAVGAKERISEALAVQEDPEMTTATVTKKMKTHTRKIAPIAPIAPKKVRSKLVKKARLKTKDILLKKKGRSYSFCISLDAEMVKKIDAMARAKKLSRSAWIREASQRALGR